TDSETMYQLFDRSTCTGAEFLRLHMERTGDGEGISVRELAAVAGISHSTIGTLITGRTTMLPHEPAAQIAKRLGVDLSVLWVEAGRSTSTQPAPRRSRRSRVPA
ncbi:helix-turn-helix domain-containing protein, partial [Streptomyces fructofermentans]|uniref:helix-turn-helix domain-containing protein n=1 Tax=Streptomyces fructofermentans TaxID=152141 RepID=UPI0027E5A4A7